MGDLVDVWQGDFDTAAAVRLLAFKILALTARVEELEARAAPAKVAPAAEVAEQAAPAARRSKKL